MPCGREALVRRWRMGRRYEKEGERYVLLPRKGVMVPARLTQVIALATVPNPERRPRAERTASGEIVWKGARPRKVKPRQKHKFVYRMDTAAELRFRGV